MGTQAQHSDINQLSYLDASKVSSPAGTLSELDVQTCDGKSLGSIKGVVIDAAARRACYFDVRSSGWLRHRRYLLPVDQLAKIDTEHKTLRLRADPKGDEVQDLDTKALREFSDEDLLAAVFSTRAV